LAEGVTEDVATTLGRVDRLVVKTPAAVRRSQRLTPGNLRTIGAALGVRYLVDGGVRRAGTRYRVTVRLVRAADEVTTWGETYDRSADQLLDVPAEIASGVATVISGTLSQAERTAVGQRPTRDPLAYDEYVRGNFLIARRQAEPALLAVHAYERALQRDSTFVPALARAALAYALFLDWSWPFPGLTSDSLLARGDRLAERAVRLDPGSSDAWLARGYLSSHEHPQTFAGVLEALTGPPRLDRRTLRRGINTDTSVGSCTRTPRP
jgi:adenylate cyclase